MDSIKTVGGGEILLYSGEAKFFGILSIQIGDV